MQNKQNWFLIGLVLVSISMQMESWGKYVVATFAGIYIIGSFASDKPKDPRDKFKQRPRPY